MPVPFVLTCLGNIGGAVLGKVGGYLVAPIQRQFKYMCCFDSNITELEAQLEMFQRTRQGVQFRVENERENVRIIDPNVEAWLRSADEVTREVDGITQEKPKVKEGCLNGWCPNLKLRYSLSRKAVKTTEVVVKLQAAGVPHTQISYSPHPTSLQTIPNGDFMGFESRRLTMEKIIKALKLDEIKLIGICGMGGTGKTTMVKEIAKRAKEESLFDEVAIVVVGQKRDPTNVVQACTAEMLSLKDLRHTENEILRADLLRTRLLQDNKKILVILDDIWAEMDLENMGFPLRGANKNFKMLYTSRTRYLWHDLQIKKEIPLELLTEDEAWKLFREKVGDLADARDLQPIAKNIVNECGCLPLALVLVGGALSKKNGRNAIKEMWEGILDRLTCASNIHADEGLYSRLELSYEYLEYQETKRLFLLCCLFEEDENIYIEDLGRYGFGLSFFDKINEMEKVRRQILLIIDDLKSRYLLLEGDQEGCVKVHDVVRDMGISIASREGALVSHGALSKWPRKDSCEHYTAISVTSRKIKELPGGLLYPNLEFLMLRKHELEKLQPNFFEGMEKLKVLVLEFFHGILTFQPLRNLTTLSLEGFGGVLDNVCAIRDLVNLEILSFRNSQIKELPEEIGELVNLRLLDLHATISLQRIARGVISRLERLEELYVWCSGFNWEGEGKENANLRELESLSNLNTLEIEILSNDIAPIFIPPIFGELKMYKVFIGERDRSLPLEFEFGSHPWELKPYKRLLVVSRSTTIPLYLLRSSDGLYLEGRGCNDLVRELLLRNGVDGLQQLKHLKIYACDTPECLANTMNLFPVLECLDLCSLSYLRQICRGPVPTGFFRELTRLHVIKCGLLENLFELPIGGSFAQLNILTIRSCIMMKEVFRKQQREDVPDATKRIEFPKLETMDLEDLPSLIGFCEGIDQIDFPKLKGMNLKSLGKFKRLFHNNSNLSSNSSEEDTFGFLSLFSQKVSLPNLAVLNISKLENLEIVGHDPLSVGSLSKLEIFSVGDCGKLLCVLPSKLVPMLQNLKRLTVKSCHLLEVVFELEGVDTKEPNPEILPALNVVKLRDLPRLIYISKEDPIGFRYIQTLEIDGCHSLSYVFAPTVMKSISLLCKLKIQGCEMLSRIVAEQNGMGESSVDEVKFPQLETLVLHDLPNLVSLFPRVNIALPKSTDRLHNPMQPQSLFNEKVSLADPTGSFRELTTLSVTKCGLLEILFELPIGGCFAQLKMLTIRSCITMKEVFRKQQREDVPDATKRIEFPKLEILNLADLPSLIGFCGGQIDFPKMKSMNFTSIGKFKRLFHNNSNLSSNSSEEDNFGFLSLFPQKVSLADPTGSFRELTTLSVTKCGLLEILFELPIGGCFAQLKMLTIRSCIMMKEVFRKQQREDVPDATKRIEFPKLEILILADLPSLISFCGGQIDFPKMKSMNFTSLGKFKRLFHNNNNLSSNSSEEDNFGFLSLFPQKVSLADPTGSFRELTTLSVTKCGLLEILFEIPIGGCFAQLKMLTIRSCIMMKEVFRKQQREDVPDATKRIEFPKLEILNLADLPSLIGFCGGQIDFPKMKSMNFTSLGKFKRLFHNNNNLSSNSSQEDNFGFLSLFPQKVSLADPTGSFRELTTLYVTKCGLLENLFELPIGGCFTQLKMLTIRSCIMMKEVFRKQQREDVPNATKRIEFPKLETLDLEDLPSLIGFCGGIEQIDFPKLKSMNLKSLGKFKHLFHNNSNLSSNSSQEDNFGFLSLFPQKVAIPSLKYLRLLGLKNVSDLWCSELPSSSFSKLENLEVIGCASLRNMFHPSMSRGLVNLKELLIEVCSTLEVVVGKEEEVGGGHGSKIDKTLFPLLGKLKLRSLPNLKRFCNSTHPLELPKLSQMDILFCPSMDAFSSEPVRAPNLTLPGISWNGDLNNAIQFLRKNGNDPMARSMEKPRTLDDVTDKFKPWQVAETQCRLVAMPDSIDEAHKVFRLLYTNSGNGVLALGCNGIMRLWKWGDSQHNPSGMATASVVLQQWKPASGLAMTNDVTGVKREEAVPCIALSESYFYVISACGGVISIFNMMTFEIRKTFMPPPPASTFLAFYPRNNHIIAIGREDSTICIYNHLMDKVICILKGHQKRITGLAFSTNLKILVSSGADAQLCIWSTDTWVKLKSVPIQLPAGKPCDCDTGVQFHSRQIRLLVFHETQLAIYDASKMDRIRQWVPQDVLPAPISYATYSYARYSCDNQLVYVSFCDGNIGVFDADSLMLRCHITPSVYLSPALLSGSQPVYPLIVAAHPHQPNQFVIGLTDGSVIVMELPTIIGLDGGTASSSNSSNQTPGPGVDVDEVLEEDVDEDVLITNRSRARTATMGTHDNEEDLEEKRKKEEEEERKKKKGKAPLLDEHEEY